MFNLKKIVATYSEVGPTAPNDSSIALMKQIQRRTNSKGKRGQSFGVNNKVRQISGVSGDSSQQIYFSRLFPRLHLKHSTA
jgi:hypothetical protein